MDGWMRRFKMMDVEEIVLFFLLHTGVNTAT